MRRQERELPAGRYFVEPVREEAPGAGRDASGGSEEPPDGSGARACYGRVHPSATNGDAADCWSVGLTLGYVTLYRYRGGRHPNRRETAGARCPGLDSA